MICDKCREDCADAGMDAACQSPGMCRVTEAMLRYPYTHHGPPVHGSKMADYLISELSLRDDCPELFGDDK